MIMKPRDIVLLSTARLLKCEIHTPFGTVPITIKRDETGKTDVIFHLEGNVVLVRGKHAVVISRETERAHQSAYKTLLDCGAIGYG